jgi:hypothetical protein
MNTIIILGVILIPTILIIVVLRQLNKKQWRRVEEMRGHEPVFDAGFRNALEIEARVVSKDETIVANAGGYAKVNLQVLIHLPDGAPYQVTTCWLVQVDSLDQILPGNNISIKVDPRKPSKILPNVPWAKPWIFGE